MKLLLGLKSTVININGIGKTKLKSPLVCIANDVVMTTDFMRKYCLGYPERTVVNIF